MPDDPDPLVAPAPQPAERPCWLAVLARASTAALEALWQRHGAPAGDGAAYRLLRRPECGMVMLRGRIGGGGEAFNLGEAAVSRCAVTDPDGIIGVGYALGRDLRKVELIAAFDRLLQREAAPGGDAAAPLRAAVVAPLAAEQARARAAAQADAAASRVEFFTLVRGS